MSLKARANFKLNLPQKSAALEELAAFLGKKYEFEVNEAQLIAAVEDERAKENLGKYVYKDYLSGLVKNLKELLGKDEMYKQAFIDAVSKNKITLIAAESDQFVSTRITDGVLTIVAQKKNFPCNMDKTGSDILDILE